jgi:hypothetical protein
VILQKETHRYRSTNMSTLKGYRLLTTAIVAALHTNEPTARGAVWAPTDRTDQLEADALVKVGYAEETNVKATHETIAEKNAGKGKKAPPLSGDEVDAIRQPDGTFLSAAGVQVNEDGTPFASMEDTVIGEFLAHNAADVVAALADATPEHKAMLPRMAELETAGKGRKTVLEAIEAAKAAE